MNKQYQLRIDILNMILRFMVTFTIVSMLSLLITNGPNFVWRLLILFQASVISFIIDKWAKYIWSYIVLHLALMAFYFFLTADISLKIIYMIYILAWAITQLALSLKYKIRNTSIVFIIFFIAMYSVCRYTYPDAVALSRFFFFFALAYGLIYIVNKYFINLAIYLYEHKDIANIPIKQIKATNRIYIVIFVYLSFVSMLAFQKFPMDKIFSVIGQLIVKFLRFALSGLDHKPAAPKVVTKPEDINIYTQQIQKAMQDMRPDKFWQIVQQIMMGLMVAVFVIIILIMLFFVMHSIYKMLSMKRQSEDDSEKVETVAPINSWASIFEGMNSSRKKLFNKFGKTNNEKIRKLYQKAVQRHARPEQELKYDTPEQLSRYAVPQDSRQADEEKKEKERSLTGIYEKARYSKDETSREEVQEVKNLIK